MENFHTTNQNSKPVWMSDPLVSNINPQKLTLLQEMVFEAREKNKNELLKYLMKLIKSGSTANLSFTDEELSAIFEAIKKNSTPRELEQIQKFMELRSKAIAKSKSR